MHALPADSSRLSVWMAASAALFFLLALSVPNGYSWGAGLLLGGALAMRWRGRLADMPHAPPWSVQDRTLCILLAVVFLANAVAVAWHGDGGKYLDQGVRYLLVIPVVWGLRQVRLRADWIWAGLAVGCMGAAAVAWWQIHQMEFERASGFITSAIPFGDIALLMAFWCLLGAALMAIRHRIGWTALLLAGALAGTYAFITAATRGGLVALPILFVLAAVVLIRREHARLVLTGFAVIVVAVTLAFTLLTAGQVAESRFSDTFSEWRAYSQQGQTEENNVGSRLEAWKAALISIPERPLLGWSYTDYDTHLGTLVQAGRVNPYVVELSNTHNQFLEIWLHQGTLGLVALLALLIASFWYFAQRLRHADIAVRVLACCGASLPAAFAAFGLTQVILGRNNGVMFFVVSLAIWWAAMRGEE